MYLHCSFTEHPVHSSYEHGTYTGRTSLLFLFFSRCFYCIIFLFSRPTGEFVHALIPLLSSCHILISFYRCIFNIAEGAVWPRQEEEKENIRTRPLRLIILLHAVIERVPLYIYALHGSFFPVYSSKVKLKREFLWRETKRTLSIQLETFRQKHQD